MTTLIKLTMHNFREEKRDGTVYINPAQIVKVFEHPDFKGKTFILFDGGSNSLVEETPEKIQQLIFNAEHPQCKL